METSYNPNASNGGWLARLSAIFGGGGTPAYAGGGQPSPGMASGLFGGSAPPYASASSIPTVPCSHEPSQMSCPIDPQALAAGQIAIVIPRSGP